MILLFVVGFHQFRQTITFGGEVIMNHSKQFPIFEVLALILQRPSICPGGMERVVEFVTGQKRISQATIHACWSEIIDVHPIMMKANIDGFDDADRLNGWLGNQVARFGPTIDIWMMSFKKRQRLEVFLQRSK